MSGIKFELQKEFFQPRNERLYVVTAVNAVNNRKKKSLCYLCVAGSIERQIRFTIYLVINPQSIHQYLRRMHETKLILKYFVFNLR